MFALFAVEAETDIKTKTEIRLMPIQQYYINIPVLLARARGKFLKLGL